MTRISGFCRGRTGKRIWQNTGYYTRGIVVFQVPQISMRDWDHFASDMEYCAGEGSGAVISRTFADICYFKKSKILHIRDIRGSEGGFDVHVAMSRNRLLLVTCGCWQ